MTIEKIDFDSIRQSVSEATGKAEKADQLRKDVLEQNREEFAEAFKTISEDERTQALEEISGIGVSNALDRMGELQHMVAGTEAVYNKFVQMEDLLDKPGAKILSSVDPDQTLSQSLQDAGVSAMPSKLALSLNPATQQLSSAYTGPDGPLEPNEVNTPRLSRGVKRGTLTEFHESNKSFAISPSGKMIEEPDTSEYQSVYPFNKVEESESGHTREVDDTKGMERIKESHMAGTFYEIHPDGTKVTKVMGDEFSVTIRDKTVKVEGSCAIHVNGDAELFCLKDVNMMSMGSISAFALMTADITSIGSCSITGMTDCTVGALGTAKLSSLGRTSVFAAGAAQLTGLGSVHIFGGTTISMISPGSILFTDSTVGLTPRTLAQLADDFAVGGT